MERTLLNSILTWVESWINDYEQSGLDWTTYKNTKFGIIQVPTHSRVCPYLFKRGKRIGTECGSIIRDGVPFCSKHKSITPVGNIAFRLDLKKITEESEDEPCSSSQEADIVLDTEVEDDVEEDDVADFEEDDE